MKLRNIESVITPPSPHFVGDGFRVHNFIPYKADMQRMSPFIMMDYGSKFYFPLYSFQLFRIFATRF